MTDHKRKLMLINLVITCFASSMLATALTTALPSIVSDLQIPVTTGQWLTSGYSLVMAIMMPLTAYLVTRFPTRNLYIGALGTFLAGLVVCATAPDFILLMTGRILQACGNGVMISMAQVIILTIFPPEHRGTAMGWYGLAVGAAPVISPTLSGILVDTVGWRMIFWSVFAVMSVSFIMATRVFSNVLHISDKSFDAVSFILSVFTFGCITLGIGNAGSQAFLSFSVAGLLVTGLISGYLFVNRQLRLKRPFLDVKILVHRRYRFSVIGSMLLYLVMMSSSVLMPLYVQTVLGYSAIISGLVTLPGSLAMAIVSPLAGKLYDKVGMRQLFITGAACMLISCLLMSFVTTETPLWQASLYNAFRSISIGCLMMPVVTWGNTSLTEAETPHGTALLTSLRTVSGAIGMALFVGIMNAVAAGSSLIHGLNVSFLIMSIAAALLLWTAVSGTGRKSRL